MRKTAVFLLILVSFSCTLFRSKVKPYPTGVIFPLEAEGEVAFEGRVVDALIRGEDGRIYFSTDKGLLCCLDMATKQLAWCEKNASPFGSPPAVGQNRVFVWDERNVVCCFDSLGNLVWKKDIADRISSPIARDKDRIYIGSQTGALLALSQETGETLWQFQTGGPVRAAATFFGDSVIIGSSDGWLYFLSSEGRKKTAVNLGSPILVAPLVDGNRLYAGTEDCALHCYDLRALKRKWRIAVGGKLLASPKADKKRVYFQTSNSVLYALNKAGGDILWWWISPSRSPFALEFDGQNVLVASRSPLLFSVDIRSGKTAGHYEAKAEVRSNPVWAEPDLAFASFDPSAERGIIAFLRKAMKVAISASLPSPQPAGTDVDFTASATGFYLPRYEFYLRQGEERTVVQKTGESKTWSWFADKEGAYIVGVRVSDQKQSMEAEIPYEISKKEK